MLSTGINLKDLVFEKDKYSNFEICHHLFIMIVLKPITERLKSNSKQHRFSIELTSKSFMQQFLDRITKSDIEIVDVNSDNTIYLESNCGIDSITSTVEAGMLKWINQNIGVPVNMVYNAFPISNKSCIVKI